MLSLPVVAIADLAGPAELFRCAHFNNATLSAGSCIARQGLRKKAKANAKDQSDKVPYHLEHCASGECEQGNQVKTRLPDYVPPDKAEQVKRARRAQGAANLRGIEERIAAKVRSGELRVAAPLPPAIADDLADPAVAPPPPRKPPEAEPKKEEPKMPSGYPANAKPCTRCGGLLNNKSTGDAHARCPKKSPRRPHKPIPVRRARAATQRKNGTAPAERISPSLLDVEQVLSERIAYHEGEATRLGRALKMLKGEA